MEPLTMTLWPGLSLHRSVGQSYTEIKRRGVMITQTTLRERRENVSDMEGVREEVGWRRPYNHCECNPVWASERGRKILCWPPRPLGPYRREVGEQELGRTNRWADQVIKEGISLGATLKKSGSCTYHKWGWRRSRAQPTTTFGQEASFRSI